MQDILFSIHEIARAEAARVMEDSLTKDKYSVAPVAAHTHNGADSLQYPFENIFNASEHSALQRTTLTAAQVKALHTTPIILVPAMGTRTLILVENVTAELKFNTIAFVGVNPLQFRYTNGAGTQIAQNMSSAFLDAAATAYDYAPGIATEYTPVLNAPIVVVVSTADPTAGNSPITFVVKYRLVSF